MHKIDQVQAQMDDAIYHLDPNLPMRLGDMKKLQLKGALFVLITHLKRGGTLHMREGDVHQKIRRKYRTGDI